MKKYRHTHLFLLLLFVGPMAVRASIQSDTFQQDSIRVLDIPTLTILGMRDGIFHKTPGAVAYLGPARLLQTAPVSGNEVLRKLPGVHVVDEEGAGLRLNLSVRGLDPDRSRGLLVLEDGIPVALNPYGEPELYYTPAIERMSGVELVKGSGQILFGPQTIGGVLNYITADPPESSSGLVRLTGGQGAYFSGLFSYGTTVGNTGFRVNYLHKQADHIGYVGFKVDDLTAKWKIALSDKSALILKTGVYMEESDATYIGLTTPMFERGDQDFVKMAPDDRLRMKRFSGSAAHALAISDRLKLTTTLFGYTTTRDWQRQDFSTNPAAANRTDVVWGDPNVPGGAVFMLNSTGNRNRQFEVAGLEPRLHYRHQAFGSNHELDLGARVLLERAFEQRINGTKKDARSGNLVEDEIRSGRAYSIFAQQKFFTDKKWSLSAGLRMEHYDYERHILRNRYGNQVLDTSIVAGRSVTEVIPGIGFNYRLDDRITVFGGTHKGFAPPRVKDAVTAVGEALDLEAESSWNHELGLRKKAGPLFSFEITGFFMDFSNQIIPVSESSGGTGTGLVNGGRTQHRGIEAAADFNFGHLLGSGFILQWGANGTFVRSTFEADRFVAVGEERVNIAGNQTPYAPQLLLNTSLVFEIPAGWGISADVNYAGAQFSDELNTEAPSTNGRTGKIPSYYVIHANTWWRIPGTKIRANFSVKNLTDQRYIVTRRPQGIRLGLPRYISGGLEIAF